MAPAYAASNAVVKPPVSRNALEYAGRPACAPAVRAPASDVVEALRLKLDPEVLESRYVQFLAQLQAQITHTRGHGGGVGLYVMLRHAMAVRARIIPGRLTEITVRIGLTMPKAGEQVIVTSAPGGR